MSNHKRLGQDVKVLKLKSRRFHCQIPELNLDSQLFVEPNPYNPADTWSDALTAVLILTALVIILLYQRRRAK